MIRIGIDCRSLAGNRAGIGTYLFEILRQFAQIEQGVTYYLYAPTSIQLPDICKNNDRFVTRIFGFRPGVLWIHTVLPFLLFIDKINVFWGPNYTLPIWSLSRYSKILTIHDATFAKFPETMHWTTRLHNRLMLPIYCRRADQFITDSYFSRKELCETLNLKSESIEVIHLAARQMKAYINGVKQLDKPYILCVGTIEPRKNIENLIAAFSKLPLSLMDSYQLVFAGAKGWGGINLQQLFDRYNVQGMSVYLGPVDDEVLELLYHNATVFVFPSIYEGFGLPVIEAMSMGTPVICSDTSSIGEITNGAAWYCDVWSIDDIKKQLQFVLEHTEIQFKLSEAGKRQAAKFNWHLTAESTLRLLMGGLNDA